MIGAENGCALFFARRSEFGFPLHFGYGLGGGLVGRLRVGSGHFQRTNNLRGMAQIEAPQWDALGWGSRSIALRIHSIDSHVVRVVTRGDWGAALRNQLYGTRGSREAA